MGSFFFFFFSWLLFKRVIIVIIFQFAHAGDGRGELESTTSASLKHVLNSAAALGTEFRMPLEYKAREQVSQFLWQHSRFSELFYKLSLAKVVRTALRVAGGAVAAGWQTLCLRGWSDCCLCCGRNIFPCYSLICCSKSCCIIADFPFYYGDTEYIVISLSPQQSPVRALMEI